MVEAEAARAAKAGAERELVGPLGALVEPWGVDMFLHFWTLHLHLLRWTPLGVAVIHRIRLWRRRRGLTRPRAAWLPRPRRVVMTTLVNRSLMRRLLRFRV